MLILDVWFAIGCDQVESLEDREWRLERFILDDPFPIGGYQVGSLTDREWRLGSALIYPVSCCWLVDTCTVWRLEYFMGEFEIALVLPVLHECLEFY